MGRSQKEERLNHSGYTIETGHGGLKRNARAKYKGSPQTNPQEGKSGWVEKVARVVAAASGGATDPAAGAAEEKKSGFDKTGDALASIVTTYKDNNKKKSGGTGGGRA